MKEKRISENCVHVYIVDSQALWRSSAALLVNQLHGCRVTGEADSGEMAVDMVRRNPPDLVLMEVSMPGIGGIEAVKRIRQSDVSVKIIMLTSLAVEPFPSRALQAGADGYLTKRSSVRELDSGIRTVMAGQSYICPEVANSMALSSLSPELESPFEVLSVRELQIATLILQGQRVTDIAKQLHLSPKTINSYRYRIFQKLSIDSDVELVILAHQSGLMEWLHEAY